MPGAGKRICPALEVPPRGRCALGLRMLAALLFLLAGAPGAGQNAGGPLPQSMPGNGDAVPAVPLISRLDRSDPLFVQYSGGVETARRRLASWRRPVPADEEENDGEKERRDAALLEYLAVYAFRPEDMDILSLAARCNVPYSSIASLNRLSHRTDLAGTDTVLLPTMPGLFIPLAPETDLERLLTASREPGGGIPITVRRNGRSEAFLFFPGGELGPTERIFFLTEGFRFRFPLKNFRVTDTFGPRTNPVTGNRRNHQGLDLAAPQGTEVYATRDGTVLERGYDPVYGNYVILGHGENWASLYGHLSEISVPLQARVRSGNVIGRVGSTGQSTGPHLHFEIRQYGRARDPGSLLFREGRQ